MNYQKPWVVAWAAFAAAVAAFVMARARAARQLREDVVRLFVQADADTSSIYHEAQLVGLPAPVQGYFHHVLCDGQPYLRGLRLQHAGQFRTGMEKDWVDIKGEEYMTADPPGFIWQGTTRQFTARDEYVAGRGRLEVRLLGALPVLVAHGPTYDKGELLRWLGESVWMPTALLPGPRVRWDAADEHTARLTLTLAGQTVSYLVRFNEQHEIEQIETQRYQAEGRLLPWVGRLSDYQMVQGVRVPMQLEGSWVIDSQSKPYARFVVQELAYDQPSPF
ncbi:DUF6544 family protein [Hymenobacter humi]|uniref:DUF6544 family protein n=1 Tax=Hymenobacter humi TaxID=1411620 RepID=A0ABW2UFE4_9BACT